MTLATNADFLAVIAKNPHDDTPRLIYADWLEEHGNQPERAEFIRVQCELTKYPRVVPRDPTDRMATKIASYVHQQMPGRWGWLVRREKKLLKHWFCEWSNEFYGAIAEAAVKEALATGRSLHRDSLCPPRTCEFRRGFIAAISLSCADFLKYAADIIEAVPMLEEVQLSDRRPWHAHTLTSSRWGWTWSIADGRYGDFWVVPTELFVLLPVSRTENNNPEIRWWCDDEKEAIAALSSACLAFTRWKLIQCKRKSD